MPRWDPLTPAEMEVLQTVFWSAATSRHHLASRLSCSKSRANGLVAALIEQGLVEEAGLQTSTGGRRPETLQLAGSLAAAQPA